MCWPGEPVSLFAGKQRFIGASGARYCPAVRLICTHVAGTSEGQMLEGRIVCMVMPSQNPSRSCGQICSQRHDNREDDEKIWS